MDELRLINMADVPEEVIDFLWYPYIAYRKITIVQGDPGEGKTTMMLAIAAALTRGECLSGGGKCAPANVIFQSAEDGLSDTIKPRLKQLGADCKRVEVIDEDARALSIIDERIETALAQTKAKLLILDPIQGYLGGKEMNSANSIRPMMKRLATVAEDTGAAVVLIGHLNKNTDSKSLYRGLGSIDIPAAARSVLTVGRLARVDENTRAFIQTKSNLAPTGKPQSFVLDPESGFKWLGECEVTVKELLDGKPPAENGGASQLIMAQQFIRGMLTNGDVPASDAFSRGEVAGFPSATMKRAKGALDVKSVKRGNEWFWVSEEAQGYQETQDIQEAQSITVSATGTDDNTDAIDSLDTVAADAVNETVDPLDTLPKETLQIQDIQEAHSDDALDTIATDSLFDAVDVIEFADPLDTVPGSQHKSKSARRRERRRKARAAAAAGNTDAPVPVSVPAMASAVN